MMPARKGKVGGVPGARTGVLRMNRRGGPKSGSKKEAIIEAARELRDMGENVGPSAVLKNVKSKGVENITYDYVRRTLEEYSIR